MIMLFKVNESFINFQVIGWIKKILTNGHFSWNKRQKHYLFIDLFNLCLKFIYALVLLVTKYNNKIEKYTQNPIIAYISLS